jgi:hypothetical protein
MSFFRETFPLVAGITNEICRNIRSREAIKHVTSRLETAVVSRPTTYATLTPRNTAHHTFHDVGCWAASGTGILYDVSIDGCKIQRDSTPPLGASLKLRLAVPPREEPVKVDAAIVGWTIENQYFGVKFLDVKSPERLALDQFIASLGVDGAGPF